jgi:hypothetical protein
VLAERPADQRRDDHLRLGLIPRLNRGQSVASPPSPDDQELRTVPRSLWLLVVPLAALTVAFGSVSTAAATANPVSPLSARGALLSPSRVTQVHLVEAGTDCSVLLTGAGGQCGTVHAAGGDLLYTVEPARPVPPGSPARPWTVTVYRSVRAVAGGWRAALRTRPEFGLPGPRLVAVTARTANLTLDGHESLVLGYRSEGTGAFLDVDIVTGSGNGPRVAAHTQLDQGVVIVDHRALTTYTPVYRRTDANCCPTSIQRDEVQSRPGSFVIIRGPRLPSAQASEPPSDLT